MNKPKLEYKNYLKACRKMGCKINNTNFSNTYFEVP